ncbi:molybdenum cofactor guanylyltransferase [Candidatus Fermentibacteria bacterium]|nr:molybdenum cofactor guanylyltransferase [Candidatus Fermentibacteria bacterium]
MTLPEASLLILAGGDSRRMGIPKHTIRISGATTVDVILDGIGPLFGTRMIAARDFGVSRPGLLQVLDSGTRRCPLAGILAGLQASPVEKVFVIACDMPFVTRETARLLLEKSAGGADVTVPMAGGFYEPLLAVYTRSCIGAIADHLDRGHLKTTDFYGSVRVRTVSEEEMREIDPGLGSLVNLNTPRDLREHCRPC